MMIEEGSVYSCADQVKPAHGEIIQGLQQCAITKGFQQGEIIHGLYKKSFRVYAEKDIQDLHS